jgi:hypothetical protein
VEVGGEFILQQAAGNVSDRGPGNGKAGCTKSFITLFILRIIIIDLLKHL